MQLEHKRRVGLPLTLENCLFFTISPLKLQSRYKWHQQVNIGILNRPPTPQNMVCSTPFSFWAFLISSLNLSVVLLARSNFDFMSAISAWIFTRPFLIAIEVAFFFSYEKLLSYILGVYERRFYPVTWAFFVSFRSPVSHLKVCLMLVSPHGELSGGGQEGLQSYGAILIRWSFGNVRVYLDVLSRILEYDFVIELGDNRLSSLQCAWVSGGSSACLWEV